MVTVNGVKRLDESTFELELNEVKTISFKLDEEFLREIDEMVKVLGYTNRSDLIRDAIQEYIKELESKISHE
ncbi:ribbon-helix-helix domain-containing protein [Sulfolobaceae archaeon RB850M]|jgi:metal-responsive CopG/Arc/MetJ family transcriptional regulator|nr:ribbon-helix-helix domain-containing protein [Sulfolobaceae archaeon]